MLRVLGVKFTSSPSYLPAAEGKKSKHNSVALPVPNCMACFKEKAQPSVQICSDTIAKSSHLPA